MPQRQRAAASSQFSPVRAGHGIEQRLCQLACSAGSLALPSLVHAVLFCRDRCAVQGARDTQKILFSVLLRAMLRSR